MVKLEFSLTDQQNKAKTFVSRSIVNDTFPQALLVYGLKGVGQSAFLLDMAGILLCESEEKKPCGVCESCRERVRESHDNLLLLFPMGEGKQKKEEELIKETNDKLLEVKGSPYCFERSIKEHISIGQVRHLKKRLSYASLVNRKRVVLIFGLESMMEPAANALLKVLEEPPPHTYFVLSCEKRERILPTLLSRCISLGLNPYSPDEMKNFIDVKGGELSHLKDFIPLANGSPGSLMSYEQGDTNRLESALLFIQNSVSMDWLAFIEYIDSRPELNEMEEGIHTLKLVLELVGYYHRSKDCEPAVTEELYVKLNTIFKGTRASFDWNLYATFVEKCIDLMSKYSLPRMVFLGQFMSLEEKEKTKLQPS